ncbi:hypothetical protein [Thalassococcus lentus]|uniref:Uncharacterized protein n=1 Tax=Thalassococcus lentus TaxID=1210524 RepID=A0ABT4XXQ6_9RHOB|nr:hypothetical protein [Thalassococcus lentus]MDA7426598.1 hypothetical protein [Thalassococcus lentus]
MKTAAIAFCIALLGAPVAAKDVCLLKASVCEGMYEAKYKDLFAKLRNPSLQKPSDGLAVSVMYNTFESAEKDAKRCKRKEKVSMDDFKPYFVMGQGKNKRAMMVRGKSECAWVRVK